MSTDEERSTHFQGFAKLLYDGMDERDWLWLGVEEEQQLLDFLAQAAYDFLVSSHYHTSLLDTWEESKARVARVPDMKEWPPQEMSE